MNKSYEVVSISEHFILKCSLRRESLDINICNNERRADTESIYTLA